MARLNDNLFTTLSELALSQQGSCFLQTSLGRIRLKFTQKGLAELVFEGAYSAPLSGSAAADVATPRERRRSGGSEAMEFREVFLAWVQDYQAADVVTKRSYLDLQGTAFQESVWHKLLELPFGTCISYGQIAAELGKPRASRAVGAAVGANPISLLVPCHRVLPSTGQTGEYRWGAERKRTLLDAEQSAGSDLQTLLQ